jgi:hypothetical protein
MSLTRSLTLLPLLGIVACTTVYTNPNDDITDQNGTAKPPTGKPTPPPLGPHKVAFVTSALYQGGYLGGLDGADAACGKLADAAGLTGTFKAWLSSSTIAAADRLTHSTDPYLLVDGTRVADDWADLTHAQLRSSINVDENGTTLPDPVDLMLGGPVWTGTEFDGVPYTTPVPTAGENCNGWTDLHAYGLAGDRMMTTEQWSIRIGLPCTFQAALYCLEQ